MKKRLRKKFRTGEFTEYEFAVEFSRKDGAESPAVEDLLDAFLDQIEAQGLVGGGSYSNTGDFHFSVYANRARAAVTEAHRAAVAAWLAGNPAVASHAVGNLVDAWHPQG